MEVTNLDGSSTGLPGPVSRMVPAFGHLAEFLSEAVPDLPSPFKGILRISTDAPGVSVIGLRSVYNERGEFLMTTTQPSTETSLSSSGPLLVPHLPNGGGFTTELILYSATGGQSPSGSAALFENSGQPFAVTFSLSK
jgi:hypothetical protein